MFLFLILPIGPNIIQWMQELWSNAQIVGKKVTYLRQLVTTLINIYLTFANVAQIQ